MVAESDTKHRSQTQGEEHMRILHMTLLIILGWPALAVGYVWYILCEAFGIGYEYSRRVDREVEEVYLDKVKKRI